jgi:ABC-type transport system involved in cytochrome c biogenesis permease subunit
MSKEVASRRIWPVPAAVVAGLLIFAATFFSYAESRRTHHEVGYLPLILGLSSFTATMFYLTRLILPEEKKKKVWHLIVIALSVTAVFAYLLMFLLLNLYGS